MPVNSKARFLGHAMHPMLVPIPLGALPTALVFDVLFVFTGARAWYLAAFVATLVGIAGILAAAVPGFIDYRGVVPSSGTVNRTAKRHMLLGVGILAYFVLLAIVRWFTLGAPTNAVGWWVLILSLVGVAGLTVQGYLGGALVERHHIGTEPPGAVGGHRAPGE